MVKQKHPKAGKAVGTAKCSCGDPDSPCGAEVVLGVAATGAIHYHCKACNGRQFWGLPDSAAYLEKLEAKKAAIEAQAAKPEAEPADDPKPVEEKPRERATEDMWA